MSEKTVVGLAGVSFHAFWGFSEEQYRERIEEMRAVVERLGARLVALPETFKDAKGGVAAAQRMNDEADLVILDVATFPEGSATLAFFDNLAKPLVLWGRNEQEHGSNIGHNSFCGVNFLAGNLALRGQRFRKLYGAPGDVRLQNRLKTAITLIGAAKKASGSRIGLFGEGIVPKFYDIDISDSDREKLKQRWDIDFMGIPTRDLTELVDSFSIGEVGEEIETIETRFGKIEVSADAVEAQARLLKALKKISAENGFSAIAIRCWPELQSTREVWPCPSISILNDLALPAACEGDVGGAFDMLLASKFSEEPSTLLDVIDWNDEKDRFSVWHCGPTAPSWADKSGSVFKYHNVDGRDEDGGAKFGCSGIIDMQFKPGPVSLYRTLGALDDEFAVQGEIVTTETEKVCGSFGQVANATIYGRGMDNELLRNQIFDRCLPHHFAAVRGSLY